MLRTRGALVVHGRVAYSEVGVSSPHTRMRSIRNESASRYAAFLIIRSNMKVEVEFEVTGWNPVSSDTPESGPVLSRVEIAKSFGPGAMVGQSEGEGLFCGMNSPENGAGYLVSERFIGELEGRKGSMVLHHGGLMGPGIEPTTYGDIVPGSGTEQLSGISGKVEITRTEAGRHLLILDYVFE